MGSRRGFGGVAAAVAAALLVPAGASAAPAKPVPTTGGAASVGQTSVVLNGSVNPRQAETTYFFQYGPTRLYGATTGATGAGAGARRVRVAVGVGGLAPATTYHYRLVAQNAKGMVFGRNRTFRTQRQPLGVTLAGTPNPVLAGGATVLSGALTGTGAGGRQVVLQANPFPYTQGFAQVGNTLVTDVNGGFAFSVLSLPVTTQYRVLMPQRPDVVSPVTVVGTTARVTTHVRVRRGNRRGRIRFSGRLTPAVDGQQLLIQKFRRNRWVTIARTFARSAGSSSRYVKRVRQRRGGRYRVYANLQGAHVPTVGRTVRVRRVRR
jgi:hypothetical protein